MRKLCIFLIFSVGFAGTAYAQTTMVSKDSRYQSSVEEQIEVDSVWAANRVYFSLITKGNQQFVAYYDKDRMMSVASRSLDSKKWNKITLPNKLRWDSHNSVAMGIDEKGYLHVSGNMHINPLAYYRTTRPLDISSFVEVNKMVGKDEEKVTYPKFFNDKQGRLYYSYRSGVSGNGNSLINRFDAEKNEWLRYLSDPLFDGMTSTNNRSAYHSSIKDKDGNFHYAWLWRLTPKVETCHQLCYATSPDLINWKNAAGERVELPFRPDDKRLIVDNAPPLGGMHNGRYEVIITPDKKPVLVYVKYDEKGNTQLYVAAFNTGKWQTKQLSNWNFRWNFFGSGDQMTQGGNFEVAGFSDNGFLVINWDTETGDSGTYVVNPKTLQLSSSKVELKPRYRENIASKLSQNKKMGVRLINDNGLATEPGVSYVLKWESMPPSHGAHAPAIIPPGPVSPLIIVKTRVTEQKKASSVRD